MSPLKATTPSSLVDSTAERRGCKYVSGLGSVVVQSLVANWV
ncbi:MAG: hypothetical protein QNJ18_16315 [Xenococcaceae cyanobacterium MO_167.B52]|nr:hypothetical protein [Xenococcaceae cyanobacterium MO_167.B52]